jgi:alanine dehydrogenase
LGKAPLSIKGRTVIVGVPKEIKRDEYRVAMLPVGVEEMVRAGHQVLVEAGAGLGSGLPDHDYLTAGAELVSDAREIFRQAAMIVKVKEPQPGEWPMLRSEQLLFTVNVDRLRYLDDVVPPNVNVLFSDRHVIREELKLADLVIGSVLIPGAKAPCLIGREELRLMKPGSVIIDVAIDQGGSVETSRPTTHSDPTFIVEDVVHYCVTNMPGAVGRTSTFALCNVTLPWALKIANLGVEQAARQSCPIASAVNIYRGQVANRAVAETFGLKHSPLAC